MQGREALTDISRGIDLDQTDCGTGLFTSNGTQAYSVNASGWSDGDDTTGSPLSPASGTFTFSGI